MTFTNDSAPADAPQRTLRILQVLEPSGGGSGRHFLDLCRGLKERGHYVEAVYSPTRAEESFVRELKGLGLAAVHAVPMTRSPGLADIKARRALRRIIKRGQRFDIVHGHSSKAGALTRLALPVTRSMRIYTPHAFRTMDPTLGRVGRLLFGGVELLLGRLFTDHLICVSQDEYRHALALGLSEKRLSVIVNGVSPPADDMAGTVRASFGIPADAFVFGFIGRLSHQKAPERLVEAFRTAAASVKDAYLLMVGTGELEPVIAQAIADSGLKSRIRLTSAFTGPQAVPAFDVLVMPSRYEAMPYVLLEAAAAGKPIIATDVGGVSTVVQEGVNGRILENDDNTTTLASALVEIADPARYLAMATAARAGRNRFSLDGMVDATQSLYQRLVRRR